MSSLEETVMERESPSTYTRLNLGCGLNTCVTYLNVDIKPLENVDLVADIRHLEFRDGCFTIILAQDIIEHVSLAEATVLLEKCFRWLKVNGSLMIYTPNLTYLLFLLVSAKGPAAYEAMKWLYGSDGQRRDDDNYHRWAYSLHSLTWLLGRIGFKVKRSFTDCGQFRLGVEARKC